MDKSDLHNKFDDLYEELLELEEEFRYRLTEFGTGNRMNISELDDIYSQIKKKLKQIRKLAKEVKK